MSNNKFDIILSKENKKIYILKNQFVMLDRDLVDIYKVEAKQINQ